MKKEGKLQQRGWLLAGAFALCLVVMLGIFADGFSIVGHAESQGTVKVASAKIRAEASTSSASVGSVKQGGKVSIISQVQAADGYVWYEIWVDSTTKGFIRSDLVDVTGGGTPPSGNTATTPPDPQVEVTPVNPVSAMVTASGGTSVRIGSNASTNSKILATVSNGLALTVNGQASGMDGNIWYQVNFISNGSQVTGFIHSKYVTLSGEITPVTPNVPDDPQPPEDTPIPEVTPEPVQPTEAPPEKMYETIYHEGEWKLYKPENSDYAWSIDKLLEGNLPTVKTQKTIIIVLVILLVAAVSAVGYLIFKLKDVMDSVYFNQVETETLRKRSAAAAQGGGQRVMHTVGAEKQLAGAQGQKPTGAQGQKPASQGQRPAGAQGQRPVSQGQRPVEAQGQRPAGAQGQRPVSQGQRSVEAQGQRSAGAQGQGQRPAGAQSQRPMGAQGQRPAGAQSQRPMGTQGQRPAGAQSQRPMGAQGQRPAGAQGQRSMGAQGQAVQGGASRPQPRDSQQAQGWQSRNFMTEDDDEFEFEFLNVDENEKNG